MQPIYFASDNEGKVATIIAVGERFGVRVVHHRPDPKLLEIQDSSYAAIARFKVQQASYQVNYPVFCIDGGFEIQGLNGWPGTMTKPTLDQLGVDRLLWLAWKESLSRGIIYNALAYIDSSLVEPIVFEDIISGTLIADNRGEVNPKQQWSSLWRHFVPDGTSLTFAQLDERPEVQAAWREQRDRGNSLYNQFFTWLKSRQVEVQESG
jgi:inosine/xanthosine triphosphate pyrophosphatase family protein